jgi:hypothetical protein
MTPTPLTQAARAEAAGRLDEALLFSRRGRQDPSASRLQAACAANEARLLAKARRAAAGMLQGQDPLPLHEGPRTPRQAPDGSTETAPVVALTSIRARLGRLPRTLRSLTCQDQPAHSINLYLSPDPFLLDEGVPADDPAIREIAALGVNVYHVSNIGPYRKQIPVIRQLRAAGFDARTPLITVDDDVIYPADTLCRLMKALNESEAVIADRGRRMRVQRGALVPYGQFDRPTDRASLDSLGTGKNGIAYRLGHFPGVDEDFIGPILAPTADDLWCKWVTARYCVPTRILSPDAAFDASCDLEETDPQDKFGLFHRFNARGSNDDAMANLEAYFSAQGIGLLPLLEPAP